MAKVPAPAKPSLTPTRDDPWRIPDALWERIEPLLPPRPPHPLGCHNPRVPDRNAMQMPSGGDTMQMHVVDARRLRPGVAKICRPQDYRNRFPSFVGVHGPPADNHGRRVLEARDI